MTPSRMKIFITPKTGLKVFVALIIGLKNILAPGTGHQNRSENALRALKIS